MTATCQYCGRVFEGDGDVRDGDRLMDHINDVHPDAGPNLYHRGD